MIGLGHEVLVANARQMQGSKRRRRKNDRIDANKLARLGRMDPKSLYPIQHRSTADQIPHEVGETLQPLLRLIATLSVEIKAYDQRIEKLASEKYMHTK